MSSAVTETTPLVAPSASAPTRRTVTFTADTRLGTSPSDGSTRAKSKAAAGPPAQTQPATSQQPILSGLTNKVRRRNSHSTAVVAQALPISKIGPQRTTKTTQKLKLLPNPEHGDDGPDEESGRDVYAQFTRIKDPSARRDAARLGKADRDKLPRVTAYCTASSYRMEGLLRFLKGRGKTRGATPKQFDECIYSPYDYGKSKGISQGGDLDQFEEPPRDMVRNRRQSDSALLIGESASPDTDLLGKIRDGSQRGSSHTANGSSASELSSAPGSSMSVLSSGGVDLDTQVHTSEVFLFEYGTVVIWGMTVQQEERFLKEIAKFETEKLSTDDIQTENFNFYYTAEYQARIYNDFISLRDKRNYMTKLAISHALAQSVKTSLYEDLLSTTIEETTPFPTLLANTGSISLSRREINQKIGELFILRINIHLQGSVLDSPELMWAEPQLEPVYSAVRSYLEMDQRVTLMNERLNVLGDLLAVLKDQVGTKHGEYLEWIVIVLIAAEILVAAVNIVVDLYAGVD